MTLRARLVTPLFILLVAACDGGPDLETRTFQLMYLHPGEARELIEPYVYGDREGAAGRFSTAPGAVTVRETADNLDRIERVLARFDRPRPSVMLHFQIIRADGAADADPAIADVERELRRLFRFDGYELLADARVGGIAGSRISQQLGGGEFDFGIVTGVTEVRSAGDPKTVTLEVQLFAESGPLLETGVTVAEGQAVVLGTAQPPGEPGALILVVRADVVEPAAGDGAGATPPDPA